MIIRLTRVSSMLAAAGATLLVATAPAAWQSSTTPPAGNNSQVTNRSSQEKIPPAGTQFPNLPKLPPPSEEAFTNAASEASPLTPAQIKSLRKIVDDAERAAAAPARFTPKPVYSRVSVSLMPGETPPVVRLFANYTTDILFLDQDGNPLKVLDVNPGGASAFTVTAPKDGSNKVGLSPVTSYAAGNISVTVDKVSTPISLTVLSGQREVDYRVDVQVKGAHSGAPRTGSAGALPGQVSNLLIGLLEGVAPEGAKQLLTSSADVQAWDYKSNFYVRTSITLLSPAWLEMQRSADGTTVYQIARTPVIVGLRNGGTVQINLSGY